MILPGLDFLGGISLEPHWPLTNTSDAGSLTVTASPAALCQERWENPLTPELLTAWAYIHRCTSISIYLDTRSLPILSRFNRWTLFVCFPEVFTATISTSLQPGGKPEILLLVDETGLPSCPRVHQ